MMEHSKSNVGVFLDKRTEQHSINEQLDIIRDELVAYQQQGKISFEERIWIWSQCSKWLRIKNTIYIEHIRLFFLNKGVDAPSFFTQYDREVTLLRMNGDDSKPEKVIKKEQFDKALMTMAYLKAVGASANEASIFAAITVAQEFKGRAKKNITASSIANKYPKQFKNRSINSKESIEDEIKAVVEGDTELKAIWLKQLSGFRERFDIDNLADWIVGTRR